MKPINGKGTEKVFDPRQEHTHGRQPPVRQRSIAAGNRCSSGFLVVPSRASRFLDYWGPPVSSYSLVKPQKQRKQGFYCFTWSISQKHINLKCLLLRLLLLSSRSSTSTPASSSSSSSSSSCPLPPRFPPPPHPSLGPCCPDPPSSPRTSCSGPCCYPPPPPIPHRSAVLGPRLTLVEKRFFLPAAVGRQVM